MVGGPRGFPGEVRLTLPNTCSDGPILPYSGLWRALRRRLRLSLWGWDGRGCGGRARSGLGLWSVGSVAAVGAPSVRERLCVGLCGECGYRATGAGPSEPLRECEGGWLALCGRAPRSVGRWGLWLCGWEWGLCGAGS